MGEEPRAQAPSEQLLPDRGGPSECGPCGARFQTRFALRKHEHQGCPRAQA